MNPEEPSYDYETPMGMPRRSVVFDMSVSLDAHPSSQPDIVKGPVRFFSLKVSDPLDKRIIISALFNGPVDPNFHSLVSQLKVGLDIVRMQNRKNQATQTDIQPQQDANDTAMEGQRQMEPPLRSRLAKYRAKQARRDI